MKKRSTEILQQLLKYPQEAISIRRLLEEYSISEKTLRNDMDEILSFAAYCGMEQAICVRADAIELTDSRYAGPLTEKLFAMDAYLYKMSLEERKFYIVITLVQNDGYYSMQQLADELYVTRNTIINDCKVVREFLEEYGISFVARNKRGIKIEWTEGKIENLLIDMFLNLMPDLSAADSFFAQFLMKKAGFSIGVEQISHSMIQFTREKNIIFAKEVFWEIAVCILVLVNLHVKQNVSPPKKPETDMELDVLGCMIQYIVREVEHVTLLKSQIVSIEGLIMQRNLQPEIQSINDFELYGVISHFLLEISRVIRVDIQNDDLLIKSLLSHIKNMRNWQSFAFDVANDTEGSALFAAVCAAAEDKFEILENYLNYQMDTNMKDSIVIHICAALLRNRAKMRPCNVIVACPGSMATSKYLEAQIRNYFRLNIMGTMTTKQVEVLGTSLAEVDFVISTVHIPNCSLPVAVVSPLLTIEDIHTIQNFVFKHNQSGEQMQTERNPLLAQLLEVYKLGDSKKIAYLDQELSRILEDVTHIEAETAKKSALLRMLQQKYIKLYRGSIEWRQAMRLAAEDLIVDGYFDSNYVEKAIENVEEYGSYIIVNQGIALAHASKDAGVYADGISLLIANDGIQFEDGETVYLMFFFSQKGDTDYLDLFKEIIRLGNNQDNIVKMREMDKIEEVYQLMIEILTEY
ncbi:BglG family transcription antiterminator [Butyricicoccus sp.]|uniref:BglG family transcription antiterminator n=1 Tax=Butyricicoccus sp. TaxID=2049021 RepID=UPI003F188C4D